MNLKTLMTLLLAAAFAAPVLAQQAPGKTADDRSKPAERPAAGATADSFAALDRNNDGYLSRDEARDTVWNTRFSELDKDNDGRLSQSEFDALKERASGAAGKTR